MLTCSVVGNPHTLHRHYRVGMFRPVNPAVNRQCLFAQFESIVPAAKVIVSIGQVPHNFERFWGAPGY